MSIKRFLIVVLVVRHCQSVSTLVVVREVVNALHNIPTESQKLTAVSQTRNVLIIGEVVTQGTNVQPEMLHTIHVTGEVTSSHNGSERQTPS